MKKLVMCLLLAVIALSAYAQESHKVRDYAWYDLNGRWSFSLGDNAKWAKPNFDDRNWAEALVPSWDWAGGTGYGWYRRSFLMQIPNKEAMCLTLGQVDDNCEVYFNGEKLALYNNPRPSAEKADTSVYSQWKKYRVYYVPQKLINSGKDNTIAIRVWNTGGGEGGIRYGNPQLTTTVFYNSLPIQMAGDWLKTDGSNEWAIGFYDNCVVYKNKVWKYAGITEKDGLYELNLFNAGFSRLYLLQQAGENGEMNLAIGPDVNHMEVCSLKETYRTPKPNEAPYLKAVSNTGKATLKGFIKNYNIRLGNTAIMQLLDTKTNTLIDRRVEVDRFGAFDETIDLPGTNLAYLHLPGVAFTVPVYLVSGETTFLSADLAEFKIYVTDEYYTRERLSFVMGAGAPENRLLMYEDWLNGMPDVRKDVWDRFVQNATWYEASGKATDVEMDKLAQCIAHNYVRYQDMDALKKAKIWSARTLLSAPENHAFYNTLNAVMQTLGEQLEGLKYLGKALDLAEKSKDEQSLINYRKNVKLYVGEMLK
ncbi:beta galactosidase jelly roll domain-containing protein [Mucilaginibacter sp. CAU 1740]|uniref:beta galactosidase jelly roll domain-containing protein n=1 Tax=Mucilaginibacter sp. CAU 1740 TaxID=3140365 RepID=UPI00325B5940